MTKNQTHKPIGEVLKNSGDFNAENIDTQIGKQISIKSVEFPKTATGKQAGIVTLENGNRYYTLSKVIINQLQQLEEALKEGLIDATVNKRKNYYILE